MQHAARRTGAPDCRIAGEMLRLRLDVVIRQPEEHATIGPRVATPNRIPVACAVSRSRLRRSYEKLVPS
jgi:hypothetical protein